MKRFTTLVVAVLALGLAGCCGPFGGVPLRADREALLAAPLTAPVGSGAPLVQVSTIDALLTGVYEGPMTVGELLQEGDFGLGTFDHLDGEMVVLDKICYQINSAGKVQSMAPTTHTPFAAVTAFQPELIYTARPDEDVAALTQEIDGLLPSLNYFYAVRVEGTFKVMRTRSVPRQEPPYRPLAEVVKAQATFDFADVQGTLVGLRCPAYSKGINVPGYHFHFLTADRQAGGHVLSFTMTRGEVQVMPMRELRLALPADDGFARANLGEDRAAELKKVEK